MLMVGCTFVHQHVLLATVPQALPSLRESLRTSHVSIFQTASFLIVPLTVTEKELAIPLAYVSAMLGIMVTIALSKKMEIIAFNKEAQKDVGRLLSTRLRARRALRLMIKL